MLEDGERLRKEPLAEGIIDEEGRHGQQARLLVLVLVAIALQRAEVISVTELLAQLFEDDPITFLAVVPERFAEVAFQIGGDAIVHRPWTSPAALWSYTLGPQIVEPFDFERAVATAVGELGPDVIILPGPGDSLGGPIAQILISRRWRGLRDRASFLAMQASERPVVLAMARPDQRARVVAAAR